MSEEAVSAFRLLYEQYSRGDFSSVALLPDDVELKTDPGMPDAGTYLGEQARDWLTSWVASFDGLTLEATEFVDAGDRVLVAFTQRGAPRGGSTPVELPSWAVFTVREDLSISRMELFMSPGDARAAAGLPA